MNRREAMVGSGTWAAALALGTLSCARNAVAQSAPAQHHHHGGDAALLDAVSACLKQGNACMAHCLGMRAAGDTTMAACAPVVHDMLAAMEALSKIAARGGPRAAEFAKVSMLLCVDCEAECKKHADKHVVCRECMEACQRTIAAIQKMG